MAMRLILPALMLLSACSGVEEQPSPLDEAHNAVLASLKDPDSAQFDDSLTTVLENGSVVCGGRVNAKNSYGGYTGFTRYWYVRSMGVALQDEGLSVWQPLSERCNEALKEDTDRLKRETAEINRRLGT